jgi:hypothetical protein
MIQHIVLLSFNEKTTIEQKDEAISRARLLKEEIPGIIDIQAGLNFSEKAKGFEIGLTLLLEDRKALENYGPHPKHQELLAYLKEIGVSDRIIIDFYV